MKTISAQQFDYLQPTYSKEEINVSKILTVEMRGNLLGLNEYDIDMPWHILELLYGCIVDNTFAPKHIGRFVQFKSNVNKSILDMQGIFSQFPCNDQYYNYIAPMLYSDAYISRIEYPKPLSEDEYTEGLNQKEMQIRRVWEQKVESEWASWANAHAADELYLLTQHPKDRVDIIWEEKHQQYLREKLHQHQQEIEREISNAKKEYAHELKLGYYIKARHYIYALCYAESLRQNNIETNLGKEVKMYSTDTLGFTHFKYPISEDVVIKVHTNFGYGVSSYFRLELTYKDIPILPYSLYVNYYYANSRDLAKYTRLYDVARESWRLAFSFVVETSNLAAENPERFVREWVMNEVAIMLNGLKCIMDDPKKYMGYWLDRMNANTNDEIHYLTVRFMDDAAASEYKCYPREMAIDFKAKKISGALEFLDSLKALKPIYEDVDHPIEEIKRLGRDILPEISDAVMRILDDIKKLKVKIRAVEERRKAIETKIRVFEMEYKSFVSTRLATVRHDQWSRYDLAEFEASMMSVFEHNNPEFVKQKQCRDYCLKEEAIYTADIQHRKRFVESLEQCRAAILSHPYTRLKAQPRRPVRGPVAKQLSTLHTECSQTYLYIDKDFRTGKHIFRFENKGIVYHAHSSHSADVVLKAIGGALNKDTLVSVKHITDDGAEVEWLRIKVPLNMTLRVDGEDDGAKLCTILSAAK